MKKIAFIFAITLISISCDPKKWVATHATSWYAKNNTDQILIITTSPFIDTDAVVDPGDSVLVHSFNPFQYLGEPTFDTFYDAWNGKPEVFKNVIMLLDNHVKCGIEIDISSYEKPMRFRLVRPGSNWYTAGRTVECILEDMRSITFKIITPENKYYDEVVDISEIPFREGKTTRVSVSVSFADSDKCNITIKDLGFGEFVKSSGKVISKELVLRS